MKGEREMVPIAIVAIMLMFLTVEAIIQFIKARRGEEVYGFFMPDPPIEIPQRQALFPRMVSALTDFGICPPANVFLHEGHTWTAVEESGEAKIGIDAFVRKAIGRIDALELPPIGQTVRRGERLFALRQGSRVAEFVAPMNGTISAVSESALFPEAISSSDWICQVRPDSLSSDLSVLKFAEDGIKWIYEELLRLQDLVVMQMPRLRAVGVTMQDGPLALKDLFENLDDDTWRMFSREFLKNAKIEPEEA
jgi:glycine cleavage system H lipoate-binding protein